MTQENRRKLEPKTVSHVLQSEIFYYSINWVQTLACSFTATLGEMLEFCYTVRCSETIHQQGLRNYVVLTRYLICEEMGFLFFLLYGILAHIVCMFIDTVRMGTLELCYVTHHFVVNEIKPYRNRSVICSFTVMWRNKRTVERWCVCSQVTWCVHKLRVCVFTSYVCVFTSYVCDCDSSPCSVIVILLRKQFNRKSPFVAPVIMWA
jgi:hypothetical protein